MLHMKLFSKNLIILNSSEAIYYLLEKRSNIYSVGFAIQVDHPHALTDASLSPRCQCSREVAFY